jgi:hypothetical protein
MPFAQQFEWHGKIAWPQGRSCGHGWKAEEYGYDEEVRLATKKLFDEADVFILSFGLSEIWYDEPDRRDFFWRAVPQTSSMHRGTNSGSLRSRRRSDGCVRIRELIRKHNPRAKIVFTLSPVGLAATFRPVSCITANSRLESDLAIGNRRAVIGKFTRGPRFFLFSRHTRSCDGRFSTSRSARIFASGVHVLNCNMKAFERYFCWTG